MTPAGHDVNGPYPGPSGSGGEALRGRRQLRLQLGDLLLEGPSIGLAALALRPFVLFDGFDQLELEAHFVVAQLLSGHGRTSVFRRSIPRSFEQHT